METISTNLSMLLTQLTQSTQGNISNVAHMNVVGANKFSNDAAYNVLPEITSPAVKFESLMDSFANFKDMITTAYDGVSKIKKEGEGIRALVEQAKSEGVTDELLNKLQKEVDEKIAAINNIKNSTYYNGVNPFNKLMSLDIPDWQDYIAPMNQPDEENEGSEMQEVLASITFDMSVDGDGSNNSYKIGATATIEIGINKDGNLQIDVDASMDFDLSKLSEYGVNSDESYDLINQFIEFLTGKQNDLNTASSIVDSFFAAGTASINYAPYNITADNALNVERESSNSIKGQIVQHASIVLDSTANQIPNISINLL